jgi:hypothetical protein
MRSLQNMYLKLMITYIDTKPLFSDVQFFYRKGEGLDLEPEIAFA